MAAPIASSDQRIREMGVHLPFLLPLGTVIPRGVDSKPWHEPMNATLQTDRLTLRPFRLEDAAAVAGYCGDWDVARMTTRIPHPYGIDDATKWIEGHASEPAELRFCIEVAGAPAGAIGLIDLGKDVHELGYWIGRPFWGQGYATEAARAVVRFAFEELGAVRLTSGHMPENPASGRVLEKCGFVATGEVVEQDCLARGTPQPIRRLAMAAPANLGGAP